MRNKIILKNRKFSKNDDLNPKIENSFLKNIIAFEEAQRKPLYRILGIKPNEFPLLEKLNEEQFAKQFNRLKSLPETHNFYFAFDKKTPPTLIYKHLTEKILNDEFEVVSEMNVLLDGCLGWCPDCFQVDYCDAKDKIWKPEELQKARKKVRK